MAEGALDGVRVLDLTWGARGKRTEARCKRGSACLWLLASRF
jgi:hypothetical protein